MQRKHITELFPWLLPLRRRQRLICFYAAMYLDGNRYAETRDGQALPALCFASACPMYNRQTGQDMVYQDNKVFNLKLAAAELDGLLIRPGETFSFCRAVRHAERDTPYREGLAEVNGRLVPERGGGLCMLSNLLFWLFLHTPLTVAERHGHRKKDFPEPPSDAPFGVDATVAAGWLDLKVRNDTDDTYQIRIGFDEEQIRGELRCSAPCAPCRVYNGPVAYFREQGRIFEEVEVLRETEGGPAELLYRNRCEIAYPLPAGTEIIERTQGK